MMEELSLHIMDVLQNSLAAGARRIDLEIEEDWERDRLVIRVRDDGKGMSREELERVQDPFYTTKRKIGVGLGIPMFKWVAEHCDGCFLMESQPGKGTFLEAVMRLRHIDRPPMGKLADTLLGMVVSCPQVRFVIRYKSRKGEFFFDTEEAKEILGEVPFSSAEVVGFLKEYFAENLKEVMEAA